MAAPMRLEFDPGEMTSYAFVLTGAAGELDAAANRLKTAVGGGAELPPGVMATVSGIVSPTARTLAVGADLYFAAAREVTAAAAQARAAGEAAGGPTPGLDAGVKVVKHLGAITVLYDKDFSGTNVPRLDRGMTAAKAIADLTGAKGLATALKFDDFRKAYRDAQIAPGDTPVRQLRKAMSERLRSSMDGKIFATPATPRPPLPANASGLRRVVRTGAGLAPFAGAGLDFYALDSDKKAHDKDPSIRNKLAVLASGAHVTGNVLQLGLTNPFTFAPAAVFATGAEATGLALDVGVLALDSAEPVFKIGKDAVNIVRDKVPLL